MLVDIGTVAGNLFSGNICFEFSVLVLFSAKCTKEDSKRRKGGIGKGVVDNVVLEKAIKSISPILYPNRAVQMSS
jgi:hypothetical protein